MNDKIGFKDLKWYLKALVIYGFVGVIINTLLLMLWVFLFAIGIALS